MAFCAWGFMASASRMTKTLCPASLGMTAARPRTPRMESTECSRPVLSTNSMSGWTSLWALTQSRHVPQGAPEGAEHTAARAMNRPAASRAPALPPVTIYA